MCEDGFDEYVMCKPEYLAQKDQQIAALEAALNPFAAYYREHMKMGSNAPKSGALWSLHLGDEKREVTIAVEDLVLCAALTGTSGDGCQVIEEYWFHLDDKQPGEGRFVLAAEKADDEGHVCSGQYDDEGEFYLDDDEWFDTPPKYWRYIPKCVVAPSAQTDETEDRGCIIK